MRAVNLEDPRSDSPDCAGDSNLEDGAGDRGFDPNNYEGTGFPITLHHCFPYSHCTLKQPVLHTTMNSRSSGAILVTRPGHFSRDCSVCLKALKDKKGFNLKGAPNTGQKPPQQPKRAAEGTPPAK